MELFLDVLGETLVDTAKMLPFLFLAYLLIEYIEHRHGERIETLLAGGGRWGAVPGAVLGCVPQCGFSAIASNFYASRVITLGTLMAVYLATSDEAIPLLVSMPAYWDKLAVLMVIKVLYAIVVGFVLDFVLRGVLPKGLRGGYTGHADEVDCHEEHSDAEGNEKPIWQAALRHTLEIFVFIFAFSLVFGMIVEGVGEDVFAEMLGGMGFFQPVVAALVGLIPNCAASVLLTQRSYIEAAEDLGASPWQQFIKVILPLSMPGVASGILMVFMPTISTFAISELLTMNNIKLFGTTIQENINNSMWNYGAALSLIMLFLIGASTLIAGDGSKQEGGIR